MKNRYILICFVLASAIVVQSCRKNETAKTGSLTTNFDHTTGLAALRTAGDYDTYQLISAVDGTSGQIANLSLANGGTVNLSAYTGTAHQKWRITYVGGGNYTIMNMGSGKFLQSYLYNGKQVLIQNSADNADDQLWGIAPESGNGYHAINKASNLAITANGSNVMGLYPYTASATQIWGYNTLGPTAYRDDQVVNFFHRTLTSQGSVAFDQGSSIPLSDGRVLWIAEDSFDGNELTPDGNLKCYYLEYRNSVIIQPASHSWDPALTPNVTITNSSDGRPKQVFDIQPNTEWTWPGVGIQVGNKVYVYAGEGSGLGATNQALYVLTPGVGTNIANVQRTTPAGMSGQTQVGFALGFVKPGDGYVYAYGGQGVFFNATHVNVARFAESDPQTWTFWNGTSWDTTLNPSTIATLASTQQNVTVSYLNGKYIMMQMDLGYFCDPTSHDIYISTSSSPTGPFTTPVKVFTIEDMYQGHLNRYYTPMIHPEFDNGKNELLITYCVNFGACTTNIPDCQNNEMQSIEYQVKGVRVPYSLIGL